MKENEEEEEELDKERLGNLAFPGVLAKATMQQQDFQQHNHFEIISPFFF